MGAGKREANPTWVSLLAVLGVCLLVTVAVSCQAPHESTRRTEPNLDPGFPRGKQFLHPGFLSGGQGHGAHDRRRRIRQ